MAKRIVTKIGYVFCVEVDGLYKRFFQYVANDITQLNSSVIRVFRKKYNIDYKPNIEEIVTDKIDFYAHTVLRWGIEKGTWYKIGKTMNIGDTENIMFKKFSDVNYSNQIKSYNWFIWKINHKSIYIGEMKKQYKDYNYGSVMPYSQIYDKIKTGEYTCKMLE